jgi:hypothetical protein
MFEGVRKKTMINFSIFVLGLVVLTLVAAAYLQFFNDGQYEGEITDRIAEQNNAVVGSLNKAYKGVNLEYPIFLASRIDFKPELEFDNIKQQHKKVNNAVIIESKIPYNDTVKFLTSGGYFILLDKKGNEITAQLQTDIIEIKEDKTTLVITAGTDTEPYYLLVIGIKTGTSDNTKRVFKIRKAE